MEQELPKWLQLLVLFCLCCSSGVIVYAIYVQGKISGMNESIKKKKKSENIRYDT